MTKGYVLYNPLAGDRQGIEDAKLLQILLDDELEYYDITEITDYSAFLQGVEENSYLVIIGGDGTLHRFVNATEGLEIRQEILYFPTGCRNSFAKGQGKAFYGNPFPVTQVLKQLPSVEVKGRRYRFVSGVCVGFCDCFRPRRLKVIADKKMYAYNRVWGTAAVCGSFCEGVLSAGKQAADSDQRTLSVMLLHGTGRLRALCIRSRLFKGKRIVRPKWIAVHTGHEITVEFDCPIQLEIDGETVPDVTCFRVSCPSCD